MTDPLRRNEGTYFARENADLIAERRRALDAERESRERESHVMRCPNCGGHLEPRNHHGVTIDVCPECGGTWLNRGELELLEHVEESEVRRYINTLFGLPR
ncbi:MAG TPA: zf-TFIIB domain-containing protein [Gemmatirosa sp.]